MSDKKIFEILESLKKKNDLIKQVYFSVDGKFVLVLTKKSNPELEARLYETQEELETQAKRKVNFKIFPEESMFGYALKTR